MDQALTFPAMIIGFVLGMVITFKQVPHDWQLSVVPGAYIPELGDNQTQSVSFTAPAPGN